MKTLHSAARAAAMAFGKVLVMLECAVLAGLLICAQPVDEAHAQWNGPNHATPIMTGGGTGFRYIGPCDFGVPQVGGASGVNSDPTCAKNVYIPGLTATPSLTYTSTSTLFVKGPYSGISMGADADPSDTAWIQSKNIFDTAGPLAINPLGGNTGFGTYSPGATVQVNDNWCDATYWPSCNTGALQAFADGTAMHAWARSKNLGVGGVAIGVTSFGFGDNASGVRGGWAFYGEGHRMTAVDYAVASELAVVNRINDTPSINPFGYSGLQTIGQQIDCGNSLPSTDYAYYRCMGALLIATNNGAGQTNDGFESGIVFLNGSLSAVNSPKRAISMPTGYALAWWWDGSNIGWNVYSNSTANTHNLVLGDSSASFDADVTVNHTGYSFVQTFSTSVDTRIISHDAVSLGYIGTVSAHNLALIRGNSTIGTLTASGLTLGVAGTLAGQLTLAGSSSGGLNLKTAAAAGSNTLTLPAGTTDFTATGGPSQVVKQTSAGGAFTVGQLACADLSTASGGCSMSTTAGGDLSGTLPSPTVAKINGAALGTTTATAGNILVGSGTQWASVAMSGDATLASGGALTIANQAVTYAKIQNVSATSRVLGRITAGAGSVEELTGANVKTIAGLATSSTNNGVVTFSGTSGDTQSNSDITYTGSILAISTPNAYGPQIQLSNTTSDTSGPYWFSGKTRSGGAVSNGDSLGTFVFQGKDSGGNTDNAALINVTATTVGASYIAGTIYFSASDTAGANGNRMTIDYTKIAVLPTTVSTSTTTGSLTNAGGFGNAGDANIGGTVTGKQGTSVPAAASCSAALAMFSTSVGVYAGTGSPNGSCTAAKGSIYVQTNATTTTSRLWVNTDGGTTWANFTSSSWLMQRDLNHNNDNTLMFVEQAA